MTDGIQFQIQFAASAEVTPAAAATTGDTTTEKE